MDRLTMDERSKKAFDFASDATKQLISLSTGIIAVTITFSKDIVAASVSAGGKRVLMTAWVVYLISILCGIITLLNLTGNLEPKAKAMPLSEPTIWAVNVRC